MQEALTAADTGEDTRARVARLVMSAWFQRTIIALILLNAVTLGLETSESVMESWGGLLFATDKALLVVFTVEIALRIYAFRGRFFRDPWGIFDLLVVAIAWMPASGPLSVLRALRVLRVLRLISVVPSLRNVVEAMLAALPGMGSIVLLMLLIFYVFAVMATKLFGSTDEEAFGTLGASLFTLFQLMTLDDWANIVKPAMEASGWSLLFFMPFIVVSTFVVLNLFIGVIVESIQTLREQRVEVRAEHVAEAARERQQDADMATLLAEIRALRAEVAALRAGRAEG
ncbi:MAG: ion transporter [Rubritepida sp.]|nr:ion transporter [Rubritepida sp.]